MFDIAIIGAGPAGSTCARLLSNDFRVLVLDRRDLLSAPRPGGLEKCCGGLLAPDAQEVLACQRLGVPRDVLAGPQLFTVRTLDLDNRLERFYQRHYLNVDREKLDRYLVSLIPSSADLRGGATLRSLEPCTGGTTVSFRSQGRFYDEQARLVIGADGANSRVRWIRFAACPAPRRYLAVQEWYEMEGEPPPHFTAIFDRTLTDFYSWTLPKDGLLLVGSALSPSPGDRPQDKLLILRNKLIELGYRFGRMVKRRGAHLLRPRGIGEICLGDEQVALVGEAAGFISPSSAEGISYAFRSARSLCTCLGDVRRPGFAAYPWASRALLLNLLRKGLKLPFMYQGWLRGLVMRSGLGALSVEDEPPRSPTGNDTRSAAPRRCDTGFPAP